jgi:hypothetical protein
MRLIYYAIGGGLGHLVRARAFLHTLGLEGDATVLSACESAGDARITGALDVLRVPAPLERDPDALRAWLLDTVERTRAQCLCVDTFPAGILGELCDCPQLAPLALWHVARLLRWNEYAGVLRGAPPHYARVWRVEHLHDAHEAFLARHCDSIENLELRDAPAPNVSSEDSPPYWLVVHSGPRDEVSELIAYADEVRREERADVALWIATLDPPPQALPSAARLLQSYPASNYFAQAQRIFSAAGFNVMRQTAPFRARHSVLPMPRRFDDQFERARRAFARPPSAAAPL